MRLLRPDMAVWLMALPVAATGWFIHSWYKRRYGSRTSAPRLSHRPGVARDLAVLTLGVLTIGLLAMALMRPQVLFEQRAPIFEPRDLFLVMDRSLSMRARDVAPSRFGRAVQEIQEFLRRKPATIDRVALVGFAGASVVLSYPTADVDSVSFYLDWALDDPTPLFGTDIGSALATTLAVVRRERRRLPPVFLVISDGDDQAGRIDTVATELAREGIRVHCIGIGTEAGVPMPVPTGDGREEFLRDDYGQLVTTRFTGSTLQRLATLTGGRYFRSMAGGELLDALESMAVDERRQIGWTTTVDSRDLYRLLLAAAAITSFGLMALL